MDPEMIKRLREAFAQQERPGIIGEGGGIMDWLERLKGKAKGVGDFIGLDGKPGMAGGKGGETKAGVDPSTFARPIGPGWEGWDAAPVASSRGGGGGGGGGGGPMARPGGAFPQKDADLWGGDVPGMLAQKDADMWGGELPGMPAQKDADMTPPEPPGPRTMLDIMNGIPPHSGMGGNTGMTPHEMFLLELGMPIPPRTFGGR